MLNIIARYHQFHWRCNAFFLAWHEILI
jgi:hypothetical protein